MNCIAVAFTVLKKLQVHIPKHMGIQHGASISIPQKVPWGAKHMKLKYVVLKYKYLVSIMLFKF